MNKKKAGCLKRPTIYKPFVKNWTLTCNYAILNKPNNFDDKFHKRLDTSLTTTLKQYQFLIKHIKIDIGCFLLWLWQYLLLSFLKWKKKNRRYFSEYIKIRGKFTFAYTYIMHTYIHTQLFTYKILEKKLCLNVWKIKRTYT